VNRAEAKQFAEDWVVDAKALLDAGRWHAAYYLVTEVEARKLYDAVTDNANGVLPWIKDRW
jgi:hypothetical protein